MDTAFPASGPRTGKMAVNGKESGNGDNDNQDGSENPDAEKPGLFQTERPGILLDVIDDMLRTPDPPDKNTHGNTADRHDDIVRQNAHESKHRVTEDGNVPERAARQSARNAEKEYERADNEDGTPAAPVEAV